MALRRLSGLDGIFLGLETPTNRLHMMAIMLLDPATMRGGYSFEAIRNFIGRSLDRIPPLRRQLREVPLGLASPVWVDGVEVDLDLHVHRAALPSPGGRQELATLAAEIEERLLDRSRPMWEMWIVEGLENERVAVIVKLHHAMMDGIAGMRLMASLFSAEPDRDAPVPEHTPPPPARLPNDLELLAGSLPSMLRQPLSIAEASAKTLRSLLRVRWRSGERGDDTLAGSGASRSDAPTEPTHRMFLNARSSGYRSVAYVSLPLEEVRRVARSFRVTLNDVVLSVVSGALRRYLEPKGELPAEPIVAAVPISTHEEGDDRTNAYTAMFVSIASHVEDPVKRLEAVADATQRGKRRHQLLGTDILADWVDAMTPLVFPLAARAIESLELMHRMPPLCNLLVSNVPGPPGRFYFAGAELVGLYPLGPTYDGVGLNVTAISAEDRLDIGLVGCRASLPDLWEIADATRDCLAELSALAPAASPPAARETTS